MKTKAARFSVEVVDGDVQKDYGPYATQKEAERRAIESLRLTRSGTHDRRALVWKERPDADDNLIVTFEIEMRQVLLTQRGFGAWKESPMAAKRRNPAKRAGR